MIIIQIALALAAIYAGGAYAVVFANALKRRSELQWEEHMAIELNTFHLGLCFIVALGFLGLMVK